MAQLKIYTGSEFAVGTLKRWDGSVWEEITGAGSQIPGEPSNVQATTTPTPNYVTTITWGHPDDDVRVLDYRIELYHSGTSSPNTATVGYCANPLRYSLQSNFRITGISIAARNRNGLGPAVEITF